MPSGQVGCLSKKTKNEPKNTIMKQRILIGVFGGIGIFGMASCNVTRTVTTRCEYWQKADTSVVIQSKTIETYDASKKL